jgi:hypothetical protein
MTARTIVGYLLAEQSLCPECIHDLFIPFDLIGRPGRSTEAILDVVADRRGIDRQDDNSFSSYRFPKPIYATDVLGAEVCMLCGQRLGSRDNPAA